MSRPLVIIESPYAGEVEMNMEYAREALLDSIYRGESPFASHLLYTQVLNDQVPEERLIGIFLGLAWTAVADLVAFYEDLGWSGGMEAAREHAQEIGIPFVIRKIRA